MNPTNGEFLRCSKHPSESFTGFCSACLVERLSAARFPVPAAASRGEIVAAAAAAAAADHADAETITHWEVRPRRTLLYLFQLDDMGNGSGNGDGNLGFLGDGGASSSGADGDKDPAFDQDCTKRCSKECQGYGQLQRKRSLRQSCEWIVCCETGKDSWVPSRQSWDGSTLPNVNGAPLGGESRASVSVVARKRLHGWNEVWDRRIANPMRGFVKKPGHVLKRSLSESWRYGREDRRSEAEAAEGRVGIRINGSHSVSSRGEHSEISMVDSSHGDVQNVRHDSLMKRLYWLGRSRSVHYSSPRSVDTRPLCFYLTPLRRSTRSTASNTRGRRTHLFAGGFFGIQRPE